jgi:hypothetical protein
MILLSQAQALALRGVTDPKRILRPRSLSDGTYAINEGVLGDAAHADKLGALSAGSIGSPGASAYLTATERESVTVNGKRMLVNVADAPWGVTSPASGVLRFELRPDDVGDVADPRRVRHRAELVGNLNTFNRDVDVWRAYAFRTVGNQDWRLSSPSLIIGQWHTTGGRAPFASLQFAANNVMFFATRSDDLYDIGTTSGATVVRWLSNIPDQNEWVHVVERLKFGESGQLDLYVNGQQVAEFVNIPIGYYLSGDPVGYMQFGIYRLWRDNTMIVEYANMEWGASSLIGRVASPLPIAT